MNKIRISNSALIPALLTIACLFICWYVTLPNYYQSKRDLDLLEAEVTAARAKYNSLEQTKKDLAGMGDVLDLIYVSVSSDADEPNVISELEAIAGKHQLTLPSIYISDPSAGFEDETYVDEYGTLDGAIEVNFSVAGDFGQLNEFIKSLEKSIKFMNIISMTFSSSYGDGLIYLSVLLETYKY